MQSISQFIKERRHQAGLTQEALADKAGVGLRFIRDLEQGKKTLRLDKANQILALFGHELGPVRLVKQIEPASAKDRK
jgi:y4mF family transcriptional regulator